MERARMARTLSIVFCGHCFANDEDCVGCDSCCHCQAAKGHTHVGHVQFLYLG